jgi:hypothetical protein
MVDSLQSVETRTSLIPETPTYKVEKYKLKRSFLEESGREPE